MKGNTCFSDPVFCPIFTAIQLLQGYKTRHLADNPGREGMAGDGAGQTPSLSARWRVGDSRVISYRICPPRKALQPRKSVRLAWENKSVYTKLEWNSEILIFL